MQDHYIINGKKYVLAEEEKKAERLSGWIRREAFLQEINPHISKHKYDSDDTRMVELKEGEVIVSRYDVMQAFNRTNSFSTRYHKEFLEKLGL